MSENSYHCPICREGQLTPTVGELWIQYKGESLTISDAEYCVCSNCGADPILPDQVRRNDRRIVDAKRASDGLLTGTQIVAVRKSLEISQSEAAKMFGGGVHAFSKYERGEIAQSVAMDRLLRLVMEYPGFLDYLRVYAGIPVDPVIGRTIIKRSKTHVRAESIYGSTMKTGRQTLRKYRVQESATWTRKAA